MGLQVLNWAQHWGGWEKIQVDNSGGLPFQINASIIKIEEAVNAAFANGAKVAIMFNSGLHDFKYNTNNSSFGFFKDNPESCKVLEGWW